MTKSFIVFVTVWTAGLFLGFILPATVWAQSNKPKTGPRYKAPITTLILRTLDKDQDGELSDFETAMASETLLVLDKNKSGDLSISEMGGPGPIIGMLRNQPLIRVLDVNGDLQLSSLELEQASHSLKKLDRDGDKHLSTYELKYEKVLDPGYEEIPTRTKIILNEYAHKILGDVLPGTHQKVTDGFLLVQESSNHNDVQMGRHTYLLSPKGEIVHGWYNTNFAPETSSAKLLANGLLLRTVANSDWLYRENYPLGAHGIIELVDWSGEKLWSYRLDQPGRNVLHHGFETMPNGNILVTAYVGFTVEEAAEIGFDPGLANGPIVWFESIIELIIDFERQSASLAWQWNSWDHIIQDEFPHKPNFGVISDNPDRIDVNANPLKSLPFNSGEIHHINAISYHAGLDQVLVSSAATGEIWVIDHSTTRAEAATDAGGNAKKGGRLLYRWGNPEMIGKTDLARSLFWQQDAKWLDSDSSGEAKVLIYDSGLRRAPDGTYDANQPQLGVNKAHSNLLGLSLPVDELGMYNMKASPATNWTWNADASETFYAPFASGVSRLSNGHTLFVQSHKKRIIEITPEGERVLDFRIPGPGRIFTVEKISRDHTGLASLLQE